MAVRLKAALRTMLSALITDPTRTGQISSMDVRDQLGDHIDSLLSGPDIQATDSSIVIDRSTPGVIRLSCGYVGWARRRRRPTRRFVSARRPTRLRTAGELTIVGALGQGDHRRPTPGSCTN